MQNEEVEKAMTPPSLLLEIAAGSIPERSYLVNPKALPIFLSRMFFDLI
jgi:hypothetical protein